MRAIRIQCFQNLANYRKPSSLIIKETYPLPPYSTVIGMVHRACDFKEYHPMNVSIQGTNKGTISDLYTRYSFSFGTKYEEGRHQICVHDDKDYGVFKGIAYTELVCENHMVIHIVPKEEDFDVILQGLHYPKQYLALGRHEDLVDIERVDVVNLSVKEEAYVVNDIYIPLSLIKDEKEENFWDEEEEEEGLFPKMNAGRGLAATIYTLNKEYEITKKGVRRWKREGGKIKAFYCPAGTKVNHILTDDFKNENTPVMLA